MYIYSRHVHEVVHILHETSYCQTFSLPYKSVSSNLLKTQVLKKHWIIHGWTRALPLVKRCPCSESRASGRDRIPPPEPTESTRWGWERREQVATVRPWGSTIKGCNWGISKILQLQPKNSMPQKHGFKMLGKDFVDVSCQLPFPSVWDIG